METAQATKYEIKLRNILYLTDFSEPSEAALSFAITHGPRIPRDSARAAHVTAYAVPLRDAGISGS